VIGILLGLFVMWLVFDQFWSAPAGVQMRRAFISTLRLLAAFTTEPVSKDRNAAIAKSYSLRETINKSFDQVRALADGVLFEFGSSRQQDLALRERIRKWQPQLRTFFVLRIALMKYRLQLPGFELPEPVSLAQEEFDQQVARALNGMADRMEGKSAEGTSKLTGLFEQLVRTVHTCYPDTPQEARAAQLHTFLVLSQRREELITSLDNQIK
jgi:multidrug resistance protein MdtO